MRFMCQKHKNQLADHPESAIIAWFQLMAAARSHTDMREWQSSINAYGNALDVAEVIFASDPSSLEVNRYIRTAIEFIYTIRSSHYPADIDDLVESITGCLQKQLYPAHIELLLRPINDIAFKPLPQIERWMDALFLEDKKKKYSIH
jgi:hypothetical protein